ncbi:MAG: DMT family transporter, partial [Planctomycetaceae bacterium]
MPRPAPPVRSSQPAAAAGLERQPVRPRAAALALLTAALWGGTPVAISYSTDELPPVAVAGLRFALGGAFMLAWCRWEGSPIGLGRGQVLPALIGGVLLFFQISLFNVGVEWSNSSHGSVFINTFIFWVVAIEHFITRSDRLTRRRFGGLLLAAAGVAVVLVMRESPRVPQPGDGDAPSLLGDVVLIVSAAVLGVKIVYTRYAVGRLAPGQFVLWHDIIGVALFAAWSLAFERGEIAAGDFNVPVVLGLLYQGVIVAGLCFAIQARLLRRHSASSISVFSFATPIFGIVAGVLLRGDPLSPWLLVA